MATRKAKKQEKKVKDAAKVKKVKKAKVVTKKSRNSGLLLKAEKFIESAFTLSKKRVKITIKSAFYMQIKWEKD